MLSHATRKPITEPDLADRRTGASQPTRIVRVERAFSDALLENSDQDRLPFFPGHGTWRSPWHGKALAGRVPQVDPKKVWVVQEELDEAIERITTAGLADKLEENTTCCHAVQNKVWSKEPQGIAWEWYRITDDL